MGGGAYVCSKNGGTFDAFNTTFSGNDALHATQGGGGGLAIARFGPAVSLTSYLNHLTITDNEATNGGGLFSEDDALVTTHVNNTIISGNRNAAEQSDNVGGAIEGDSAYNLLGSGGSAEFSSLPISNIFEDDPELLPLGFNGGLTQTHMPRATSPVIDAGDPDAMAGVDPVPEFDQRGAPFGRVADGDDSGVGRIDIGAVEYGEGLPTIVDVVLDGSGWEREAYSFAQIVQAGKQLDSIFTQGINRLQIVFSEEVSIPVDALTLLGSANNPAATGGASAPVFDGVDGNVATWTLPAGLTADKYAILLDNSSITDLAGAAMLDAEWDRPIVSTEVLADVDDVGRDWNNDQPRLFDPSNGVENLDFRLHFAYLPGDYNQDGIVEAGETGGDGDGDGLVGQPGDDAVVSNAIATYKTRLIAGRFRGDYDDNEVVNVDFGDYELWRMTFGFVDDLRADGNNNGVVDAADYTIWNDNRGTASAWSAEAGGAGGGSGGPIQQIGVAPMVVNVTVSGSGSTHDPYAFDSVAGSGEQLRTVPVGGADTISITFSEDVNVVASDLSLTGLRTANRPTLAEFSYDLATMTATWRFEGWALGDHYLISLSDAVSDIEGDRLDGEWTNPASLSTINAAVSEFPSGDGTMGGDFNFVATILPGDATLDNLVNNTDYEIMDMWWWGTPAEFVNGDFDGDGTVTMADYCLVASWDADLTSIWMLADLNGDSVVDGLDGDILFDNWESGLQNPTQADGDLDADGDIDTADLDLLFAQYGLELAMVS